MTAYAETLIQDAPDGPGPLTQANDGQFLIWNGRQRRFDMATIRMTGNTIMRAMASRIQDAPDGPGSLGSGDDGKALVWDNASGRFVMTAFEAAGAAAAAIVAHVAESDPHTGYLLATGSRTGASSQAQTFTNGIVGPTWKPASDSTTAVQIQTSAAGTFFTADTTNRRITVTDGNSPAAALISTDILTIAAEGTAPGASIVSAGSSSGHRAVFKGVRSRGTLAIPTVPSTDDDVVSILGSIYDGSTTQGTGMIGVLVDGSVSAGVAPARIVFYTSATSGAARAARMTIKSDGKVGIGTTAPIAALHIIQATTGAFVIGNGEADTTTKVGRMAVQHYTNSEESLLVVGGASTSTANNIDFGGGSGVLNTATQITFYTATTNTTLTGTQRMRIDADGLVAIGSHTPAAHLHIAGNLTANAWGTTGIGFRSAAATYTDGNTASSGTATNAVANSFNTPTFAASNTTVTMTNAATVYIAAAPAAGANVTLTNAYALWVDDGAVRLDGNIGFFAAAPAAKQTVTGSRGSNAALASLLTALAAYGLITDSSS